MKLSCLAVAGFAATLALADYITEAIVEVEVLCTEQAPSTVYKTVTITESYALGSSLCTQHSQYESTMTSSLTTTTTSRPSHSLSSTISTTGAIHTVTVGDQGKLVYSPNQVNASIGDVIRFNFLAMNHTVTQSNLNTPCISNGEFDTGFNQFNPQNVSGMFLVDFPVETTSPQWFYCRQTNHCGKGMVFGLNPAGKFDQFLANAIAQNGTTNSTMSSSSGTGIPSMPAASSTGFAIRGRQAIRR